MTQNASGPVNRAALIAMILGIIALVLSLVVIGGALGLAAIIIGIVGIMRPGRKGMSITGIATGALAMMLGFIAIFIWAAVLVPRMTVRAEMPRRAPSHISYVISNLRNALDTFEIDNGRLPTTAEGLDSLVNCPPGLEKSWHKLIDTVPLDDWGHPFIYRCPSTLDPDDFDLTSMGPDGILGTPDDIQKNSPEF